MLVTLVGPNIARSPAATDSFERLFAREYPRVVAIARRVLADPHAAEDVAQEVFVAFHRGHDPDAPFAAAWLHRAAVHRALNDLRATRRRTGRETAAHALDRPVLAAVSAEADPAAAAERSESRREVRAALSQLPERSAAVLALRYAGLSYSEIAAAVGVKPGAVGTMLVRAESAFKKELARAASL
jgi:RNA polymerase sigma-70 factor (ECF subfamily)